ncbi:hypothetical protein [Streptomyces kebangsaanensis]|uniref:hypothetical protein n=1 Tax=Streptomyces kebangsaanensis TaxID=864058 RepID=UPI00093FFA69|nr:hypothetical protein [Streptomyces kebangsaanensis]
MKNSAPPPDDGPRDDGLDGAHADLASTFPPAAAPSLEHGYAWRCGGDDASGCAQAHSGTADWTDSGIEVCPVHNIRLEYRLP